MIDTIIIPSIVHESEITKTQEVEENKNTNLWRLKHWLYITIEPTHLGVWNIISHIIESQYREQSGNGPVNKGRFLQAAHRALVAAN